MREKPRVFISYAAADREVAERLMVRLRELDAAPFLNRVDLRAGDHVLSALRAQIAASDFLVLLLSPEALDSPWVQHEMEYAVSTELRQRSITLVPVKVKPCRVPDYLASWLVIDATKEFDRAADRVAALLRATPLVEFSKLDPQRFEAFVGDLLKAYGFRNVQATAFASGDLGFDFSAQSVQRDPFGRPEMVEWLVQVKATRGRADTSSLRQFLGILSLRKERGLFVTSGQLTTPAKEWIEHVSHARGPSVEILEGTELKRLAIAKPQLVAKYFGREKGAA